MPCARPAHPTRFLVVGLLLTLGASGVWASPARYLSAFVQSDSYFKGDVSAFEQALGAPLSLYATYREQLPKLYRARRYEAAIQLIKSTLANAPEAKREEFRHEMEAADDLVDFWLAVEAGVAGSLNRSVTLREARGKLVAFKEGTLELTKDDGTTVQEELAGLPAEDILRFARAILPDEDIPLAAARFFIAEGDADQAEATMKKVEAAPRSIPHPKMYPNTVT